MAKLSRFRAQGRLIRQSTVPGSVLLAGPTRRETERRWRFRLYPWFKVAIVALIAQVIIALTLREPALSVCCACINLSLVVMAACLTTRNAVLSGQAIRLFWSFLAAAYWVWALPVCVWFYYWVLHGSTPKFLLMTFPWFLHIVLMIAAVTARPDLRLSRQRPYRVTLNFLTVLFLLVFAYAYLLFPYRYVPDFAAVMRRWAAMYSGENVILLLVLSAVVITSQRPWKAIYGQLLGGATLYAVASELAHLVFAFNGRFTDGLVSVPFNVSTAWFIWVSLHGRERALELAQTHPYKGGRGRASVLATLALVAIPVVGVFEMLRPDEPYGARLIRMLVVVISVMLMAMMGFIQDYLSNRELAADVLIANDRLQLAVKSGKSAVWEWNIGSGQSSWFGDLRTLFGMQSVTFVGHIDDFRNYVHPDDREQVWRALNKAMHAHAPYTGEFRIVGSDGSVRCVAATGTCYYASSGKPERMLGVTVDITERKEAEQKLRESEMRFQNMADKTPSLIWMCDADGRITYLNEKGAEFTGPNPGDGYGNTWISYIHPEDRERIVRAITLALESHEAFSKEYRLRRRDGVYRWMFDVASPRTNGDGSFAGFIGSAIDVTDQKLAREALESVSGRLIEAQEKERTRIARELHDDICQKLAVLSMAIQRANRGLDGSVAATAKDQLEKIRMECAAISGDVQLLSHELHSSKLDYLGIGAAIRGFCKEFAKQHELSIKFSEQNIPNRLPREVSLCLFRISQEGLHNALKHSGTTHFRVSLTGSSSEVQLEVKDEGAGFDLERARQDRGLGLVSMQERMNLVQGQLNIESTPGVGTKIVATVPLAPPCDGDSAGASLANVSLTA